MIKLRLSAHWHIQAVGFCRLLLHDKTKSHDALEPDFIEPIIVTAKRALTRSPTRPSLRNFFFAMLTNTVIPVSQNAHRSFPVLKRRLVDNFPPSFTEHILIGQRSRLLRHIITIYF
jgi:hypothetical protein